MDKTNAARAVFDTLCATMDEMEWKYTKEEPNADHPKGFYVYTSARGDDLVIRLNIVTDIERQLLYVKSPLPFNAPAEKRQIFMEALTHINWSMLNGCFEMDPADGHVGFRAVIPYMDGGLVSKEMCKYLIWLTCQMVDDFNDKLQALSEGTMTMDQLLDFIRQR